MEAPGHYTRALGAKEVVPKRKKLYKKEIRVALSGWEHIMFDSTKP
jgi:hypothetical protein